MRILMLAQSFSPVVGGEERIVEDLSAELARRGHEVGVATLRQPAGSPPEREDGVRLHMLESSMHRIPGVSVDAERRYAPPGPDPLTVRDLRRVIGEQRPEVVHAHNWLAHSYLPLDRRATTAALVLSLHDYSLVCPTKRFFYRGGVCSGPAAGKCFAHSVESYGAAKGTMAAAGVRVSAPLLRRKVDMFLPVSDAVRDLSGVAGERQRVVPNFIGELPAQPPPDDPRLAELPAEPFLLYFGDVTEDKGVGVLVESYRGLERPPPLVLIGRQLIDDLPSVDGVRRLEPMPHPLAIEAVRRSLCVIAPSLLPESFGIVALEAAAAGKPAIVSDIGGLRDVVVDGETGLLVAPGDVEALRAALGKICADAEMRGRMGAAALAQARRFSPEAIVPAFESAYREALDARLKRMGRSDR